MTGAQAALARVAAIAVLSCLPAYGCTTVHDVPREPVAAYPGGSQLNLTVNLVIPDELRQAKWEANLGGMGAGTQVMPIGEALPSNCDALARAVFTSVSTTKAGGSAASDGTDAILTPRVLRVERILAKTWWDDTTMTILLEWTLKRPNGDLIWVKTVPGTAKKPVGFGGFAQGRNATEQMRETLEDLFNTSFHEMSSAPEIRRFAAAQRGSR